MCWILRSIRKINHYFEIEEYLTRYFMQLNYFWKNDDYRWKCLYVEEIYTAYQVLQFPHHFQQRLKDKLKHHKINRLFEYKNISVLDKNK